MLKGRYSPEPPICEIGIWIANSTYVPKIAFAKAIVLRLVNFIKKHFQHYLFYISFYTEAIALILVVKSIQSYSKPKLLQAIFKLLTYRNYTPLK